MDSTKNPNPRPWRRWAFRLGLPSAALALSSVWMYEPDSRGKAIAAAGLAVTSLLVFTLTMPRRMARRAQSPRRARRTMSSRRSRAAARAVGSTSAESIRTGFAQCGRNRALLVCLDLSDGHVPHEGPTAPAAGIARRPARR